MEAHSTDNRTPQPIGPAPYGEMPDTTYQAYLDERAKLLEVEREYARNYDKYVLTLAGGSLALSLTFLKDLIPEQGPVAIWLLWFSWILLVASALLVLLMMRASEDGHRESREIRDQEAAKGGDRFWLRVNAEQDKSRIAPRVDALKKSSMWAFCGGIACLLIFALVNAGRSQSMGSTSDASRQTPRTTIKTTEAPPPDNKSSATPSKGPVDQVKTPSAPPRPPNKE